MPAACVSLMVLRGFQLQLLSSFPLVSGFSKEDNLNLVNSIQVIDEERECPPPAGDRKYAAVTYSTIGFDGTYLELYLRPWIHHVRQVEPRADVVIAMPPRLVTREVQRLVNFSNAVYGNVYLKTPKTLSRADVSLQALSHIDKTQGWQDKFGWRELRYAGVWNMDEYDGVVMFDADCWPLKPIYRLFWCTERYDFLSPGNKNSALMGSLVVLRPSKHTFQRMRQTISVARIDANGGWDGCGVFPPTYQSYGYNATFMYGTEQAFFFYFFYVANVLRRVGYSGGVPHWQGYRVARLDTCKWANTDLENGKHPSGASIVWQTGIDIRANFHDLAGSCSAGTVAVFHGKLPLDSAPLAIQKVFKERQFDSRPCWDTLAHTHPIVDEKGGLNAQLKLDANQAGIIMLNIQRLKSVGSPPPYLLSFPACCDLSVGPRGVGSCWKGGGPFTFEHCCLLKPSDL